MGKPLQLYMTLQWGAVSLYVLATVLTVWGVIFRREGMEKGGHRLALAGLGVHGGTIGYWWVVAGHGPYLSRNEVLSSDAWVTLALFLVFAKVYPKVRPVAIVVFPAAFLLIALGLFFNAEIRALPPTFRSIWLLFHIGFYKIALGTIIVASALSLFYILKKRTSSEWLRRLPDLPTIDLYAYRFAGFGFIFWAIAMLAGSIWAYQSWGRFWGWDPVETWSLVTWLVFGIYLHLRRFFGWKEEKAALLYLVCFVLSLLALFYTSHLNTSIHMEYFR